MKYLKLLFALAAGIALTAAVMPSAHALAASPQISIQWGEPAPPAGNWSEAWHRGFHAGARAAHEDIGRGLRPDAGRHEEFHHPPVPHDQRHDFQEGFRRGYQMVYQRDWHHDHDHHDHGY